MIAVRRRRNSACIFVLAVCLVFSCFTSQARTPVAGVFLGEWDGTNPAFAQQLAADVQAAGYAAKFIGPDALTNSVTLGLLNVDLLVLPQARSLPVAAMDPIQQYLRDGGRLMALGLPAWDSPTFSYNGKWYSKADYTRMIDNQTADHLIADFAREDMARWTHGADPGSAPAQTSIEPHGGEKALHVIVDNLTHWNVLLSPFLSHPFPDGQTLTCFRAHGDRDTRQMSIEWQEEDGSRWIAVVDLTPEWKSYALPPTAFHFWESVPGRQSDTFNVRHAKRLSIGLARSHSGLPGAHHEYWIEDIGAAPSPFADMPAPDFANPPRLDTLSPGWKFFPMHGVRSLATAAELALVSPVHLGWRDYGDSLSAGIQPRPRGVGFNQGRPWRWQPLLEARARQGDYRGALATLLVHLDDEYRGGLWACFTPEDPAFYQQPAIRQLLEETARSMRRGLFLAEGGAEFFTAFAGQKFALGGRVVNLGNQDQANLALRLTVRSKNVPTNFFRGEWQFSLRAGDSQIEQEQWLPPQWPEGGLTVTTELLQNGVVIDRLEHELNVWRPKPKPEFIESRDGGFWLRGKPWKVSGINYMPSSGIGLTDNNYFELWLGPGAYDPLVIDRDLRRIKAMNLNTVSVFIDHRSMHAQHLLDFLRRCDELGLHVNQSLRPGTPLDFQWDAMKDLITYYHMAENDTIFAYDLAWEAEHVAQQHYYGPDWTSWVQNHYGDTEKAEAHWGVPAPPPFKEGELSVPPMSDLDQDGPWRILAADYRAFLDEELAEKYGEARRLIHSIDPHHAVSFRMNEAGDPTFISRQRLPFDFYGLARAVDIWAPEGYGRIGDWDFVRQGRFDVDYARLCDPGKPFMWAEFGYTVWDDNDEAPSPEKLDFAATFYRDFYRMATEAGCDGIISWWYPGGYRFNERSDFGVINPDGTDRPVTRVIRAESPIFLKAAKPPPANIFLKIDRDRDARGLYGIYQAVKTNYWQAIANGKTPALQWAKKPGSP